MIVTLLGIYRDGYVPDDGMHRLGLAVAHHIISGYRTLWESCHDDNIGWYDFAQTVEVDVYGEESGDVEWFNDVMTEPLELWRTFHV